MNTEIFLYRPNLVKNWNFKDDLEWIITDTSPAGGGWSISGDGYAEFTPGFGSATMTQDILQIGVTYSIRFKISNMTTGSVRVRTGTGFIDFYSNGWNEIQLPADSETFTIQGNFDGKISKVSVIEYPEIVKLDDIDEISIPLNFNVADIREPDKRNANYSKTVTVNGTKNNNKIFNDIFEISIDGIFNPNKATKAVIYQDSIEIFRGIIQLKKINRTYPNGDITYELMFLGKIGNLFYDIGSKLLSDLDLSEYNHVYDLTNQKLSWDTSITKDGSTYVNFSAGNPTGEGYVYPYINYGDLQNEYTWNVQNFKTAVYAKTYIDKIFEDINYTYTSNFFNSEFFKRLIIPYNQLLTADSFVDVDLFDRSFEAIAPVLPATSIILNATTSSTTSKLALDGIVYDNLNQVDLTNNEATFDYSGRYRFSTSFSWKSSGSTIFIVDLIKVPLAGSPQILETKVLFPPVSFIYSSDTATFSLDGYDFEKGDTVYANITYQKLSGFGSETIEIEFQNLTCEALSNAYGAIVQMNSIIPKKITQKDFLSSIFNLFNLYVETDKADERKLLIEPRDDYYDSGSVIDWTDKLDVSKELELHPMGLLNAKNYIYTYKTDADYFNKKYNDEYKEVYGTYKESIENDFISNETKTEVVFSPTALERLGTTDRVVSTIYQYDQQTTNTKDINHNIRILYYAGVISTTTPWDYVAGIKKPTIKSQSTYPYAGHFDDPSNPYIDLNFGYTRELYYEPALWSPNTLYSVYYKKMIDEITDKDSKLVIGYLSLKAKDIFELDFRNQFYIDGYYLRLNKIIDFDINKNEPVKCEFLLTKAKARWVNQSPVLKPVDSILFAETEILSGYNVVSVYSDATVKGEKNTIGSGVKSTIVYGNENTVGDDCYNISLLSSNNVIVEPGLSNVHIVGTDNVTVTSSNTSYINGTYIDTNGLPFKFNGTDIETNYTLGSPLIYPKIVPTDDSVIDLGSTSKRWKDLYLGDDSKIEALNSFTLAIDNTLSSGTMEVTFNKTLAETILFNITNGSNLYAGSLFSYDQTQFSFYDSSTSESSTYFTGTYGLSYSVSDGTNLYNTLSLSKNNSSLILEDYFNNKYSYIRQGSDLSGAVTTADVITFKSEDTTTGYYTAAEFYNTNINIKSENPSTGKYSRIALDADSSADLLGLYTYSDVSSINYSNLIQFRGTNVKITSTNINTSNYAYIQTGLVGSYQSIQAFNQNGLYGNLMKIADNYAELSAYYGTSNNTSKIRLNSDGNILITTSDYYVIQTVKNAVISNSDLSASQCSFYLDESSNELKVKVKYSDGTTVKTGSIALV